MSVPERLETAAWVTYEEVARDPRRAYTDAMGEAVNAWFDHVGRWQGVVTPPGLSWLDRPDRRAMSVIASGEVADRMPVGATETLEMFADLGSGRDESRRSGLARAREAVRRARGGDPPVRPQGHA
jgi:hypothetical protein